MDGILKDLEKITEFSKRKTDPRLQLKICKNCCLNNSSYLVSFYNNILYSEKQPIIMFISQDPNIDEEEIRDAGKRV